MSFDQLVCYFEEWNEQRSKSTPHLTLNQDTAIGNYKGMQLYSVFQPLFKAKDQSIFAHEALLRARDDQSLPLSPATAFAMPGTANEVVYFDRLCRILHALNFVLQAPHNAELFLNVSGRHLLSVGSEIHEGRFDRLLRLCGLKPEQVILEVLEARVDDIAQLNEAVEAYRHRGYRVAIDDFGCEHSNFDRLWRLTPDIVKLDRSLIVQGTTNQRARKILPKLIEIIHELGAQVVCEGIENEDQHALAIDAGTDLLQGYYYAQPAAGLIRHTAAQDTEADQPSFATA